MDAKLVIELRQTAEEAVSDMPEGALKVKAFEVILNNLLLSGEKGALDKDDPGGRRRAKRQQPSKKEGVPASRRGRILQLKDEDYFRDQRTISDVRQELATHGWHYPLTALSGVLQDLVQRRELRRQKAAEGKKRVWKYSDA